MDPAPVTHLWYLTTVNFDGSSSGSHGIVKFPFVKAQSPQVSVATLNVKPRRM
jgi:hypothetical protein